MKNFSTNKPDPKIDDQAHLIRKEEMHTVKNYAQYVEFAFPITNVSILDAIRKGEGEHWTNKTLSYMRKDAVSKRLMNLFYAKIFGELGISKFNLIDATANIGGDTLQFALKNREQDPKGLGQSQVLAFEMQTDVYKILVNNVALYGLDSVQDSKGLGKRVITKNQRFDYTKCVEYVREFANASLPNVVIIDPPFEIGNNDVHFNLSIDTIPIYYIVEQLLSHCARVVILSMPMSFKYNLQFAQEKKHVVDICYIDKKDLKMLVIYRGTQHKARVFNLVGGKTARLIPEKQL